MEKVIREVIKRRTTRASEERVWEKEERERIGRERESTITKTVMLDVMKTSASKKEVD
jgi:hypothetical protein